MLSFKPDTLRTVLETSIADWSVRKPELTKLEQTNRDYGNCVDRWLECHAG